VRELQQVLDQPLHMPGLFNMHHDANSALLQRRQRVLSYTIRQREAFAAHGASAANWCWRTACN